MGILSALRTVAFTVAGALLGVILVWLVFAATFSEIDFDTISWLMLAGGILGAIVGYARH